MDKIIKKARRDLDSWLAYINSLHSTVIDMSLERMRHVVELMGLSRVAPYTFIVGGTNGKGTTCHTIEKTLFYSGCKVGVYSSPFLLDYKDSVRINAEDVSEDFFIEAFEKIEIARGPTTLTPFEFNTLAAFYIISTQKVDVAIIEVGMGGTDDATNVIDIDTAIITNVALDHMQWLGTDRESIGAKKAGIMREERNVFIGDTNPPHSLIEHANSINAFPHPVGVKWNYQVSNDGWKFSDSIGNIDNLPAPMMPIDNAALALAALRMSPLDFKLAAFEKTMREDNLPGRFQIIEGNPRIILDVAHNPHASSYLKRRLEQLDIKGKYLFLVGILGDKDINGTIDNLKGLSRHWYCCDIDAGQRSSRAEDISRHLPGARNFSSILDGWNTALADADDNDVIVAFGSFYVVAPILREISGRRP
ncbi:bifunctional tetrahydrofolate synthase/dihydrofolate synthase [Xanthomonas hortorum]|uniref:bifunctional tetrahydrofolate synthase/dihydrofolate synthase n=1 Tax=Xanthomonas hortorum TaxID=56454 RepID=UPI0015930C54|nr:bifunctional tetrahydrofolate synthase/dihydrofolate synthase [Xanthomonas hortorum]NHF67479.1 bifunctional tetrahydrofolate synthase/dihydrofolate synthase [Xanthomonas hortorum]